MVPLLDQIVEHTSLPSCQSISKQLAGASVQPPLCLSASLPLCPSTSLPLFVCLYHSPISHDALHLHTNPPTPFLCSSRPPTPSFCMLFLLLPHSDVQILALYALLGTVEACGRGCAFTTFEKGKMADTC
ncbi:hypothetical protein IF2G_05142 [Cordyceps javanica]|nr:hypothetical protein IF2G_05142 [Cordyceps javanica]